MQSGVYDFVNSTYNYGIFNTFAVGRFLGTARDQIVAYNTSSGAGLLTSFTNGGKVNISVPLPTWTHKATHIVAGNFRGTGKSDLLQYDRTTGSARLLIFAANGSATAVQITPDGSWLLTWDILVSGDFRGLGRDDLILYSHSDALANLVVLANNGTQAADFQSHGWSQWDFIAVSDRYAINGGQSQLLVYNKANGIGDIVVWNKDGNGLAVQIPLTGWELNDSFLSAL